MTIPALPGFELGDRLFTKDGREGTVTAIRFDGDVGVWEYLLDPFSQFFTESDLSHEAPGDTFFDPVLLDEPPPGPEPAPAPRGEFVTFDEMQDFVVPLIRLLPQAEVSRADLDALRLEIVNAANLTAQANLGAHIADVERRAADVELFTAAQFSELQSMVTTTLSEISNRAQVLETAAEESSGSGFLGFIGGLGGLISNPVEWIMSRLGDHIASEVNDGLNR